jgi:23S rRNA pseudouridine1911/1915/1917 synthase
MSTYPPILLTIPPAWAGRQINGILRSDLAFSRTQLRNLKKGQLVFLNDQAVPLWQTVEPGDVLKICLPVMEQMLAGEDLPLEIIYEDADLVVVNKEPGMVVHPVRGHYSGTLANALVYHWARRHESASFHPVHRLDRWTSGLVIIAKSPWSHQQLDRALQANRLKRTYLALIADKMQPASGRIEAPIGLMADNHHRGVLPEGQPAVTHYRTVVNTPHYTLVMCRLKTGRTHQIRVHLAYEGHPLIGDGFYGGNMDRIDRPALHAWRIRLPHPRTGKRLSFTSPLPEDMKSLTQIP